MGLVFVALRGLVISAASRCGAEAPGTQVQQSRLTSSRARARWWWLRGLIAANHVDSSPARDQICVACIGRRFLIPCTTRKAYVCLFELRFWQGMCQGVGLLIHGSLISIV